MKVFIIAAVSADGYIARNSTELADWTSKEDKKVFVELTKRAGVIVMGGTTFRTIGRALPGRRNIVYTRTPLDVPGVEVTDLEPAELIAKLEAEGCTEVAICGGRMIYDMFLRAGAVDEIYLTIEPVLFGQGVSLVADALDVSLQLTETKQLNENVLLLHYEVKK